MQKLQKNMLMATRKITVNLGAVNIVVLSTSLVPNFVTHLAKDASNVIRKITLPEYAEAALIIMQSMKQLI